MQSGRLSKTTASLKLTCCTLTSSSKTALFHPQAYEGTAYKGKGNKEFTAQPMGCSSHPKTREILSFQRKPVAISPKPATSLLHSEVTTTLPGFVQSELKGHDLTTPAQAFDLFKALGTSAALDSVAQ